MTFPKLKNKHLYDSLFTPKDFVRYRKYNKADFPKKIIFCYSDHVINRFKREFKGEVRVIKIGKSNQLFAHKDIGIFRMRGIGAPYAITFLEEFIASGGKEFINFGSAGGLSSRGIFVCNKAVRDEGTSHHYVKDGIFAYPDKELTTRIEQELIKQSIPFEVGSSWTTDAPYRETKKEIAHYKKQKVKTVEMEASALFVVAKLRKVKLASFFVVSDVLGEKWEPLFHKQYIPRTLNKMLDVSLKVLRTAN